MLLSELGTILGEELQFREEGHGGINCCFPHVETKRFHTDGNLTACRGVGDTKEEAMEDYADELDGMWLVYRAAAQTLLGGTSVKKEFQLPEMFVTEPINHHLLFKTVGQLTCVAGICALVWGIVYGAAHLIETTTIEKADTGYQITFFAEPEPRIMPDDYPVGEYPRWGSYPSRPDADFEADWADARKRGEIIGAFAEPPRMDSVAVVPIMAKLSQPGVEIQDFPKMGDCSTPKQF